MFALFNLSGETLNEIVEKYDRTYGYWISGDWGSARTINGFQSLETMLDELGNDGDVLYWKARISLAIGTLYFEDNRKRESISALENSRDYALEVLEGEESSDAWRVLSDAGSFIMLQKGLGYIIANSSRIREEADKALVLNPDNARASLIVAQGLVNAPPIFGGDEEKGLQLLEALAEREDLGEEDRYFIIMALGDAYETAGKEDKAKETFQRVLRAHPGNRWAQTRVQSLQ